MQRRARLGEEGAALMVALLAAVFLAMLGMVLLDVLRGGAAQAARTEASIQAEWLAQRGLDDATALIRAAVEEVNGQTAWNYHEKIVKLEERIGQDTVAGQAMDWPAGSLLDFLDGQTVEGERGSYRVDVEEDVDNFGAYAANRTSLPWYPYSRVLTIRATGMAGETPPVEKSSRVIVSTIHAAFGYPLSADGDVSLNGAAYVAGDVLASPLGADDGYLNVYDKALFVGSPGSLYRKATAPPTIQGFYDAKGIRRVEPAGGVAESSGPTFAVFEPFRDAGLPRNAEIRVGADYVAPKLAEMNAAWTGSGFGAKLEGEAFEAAELTGSKTTGTYYDGQWVEAGGTVTVENAGGLAHLGVKNGVFTMQDDTTDIRIRQGSLYVDYAFPNLAAAVFAGRLTIEDPSQAVVVHGDAILSDGFKLKGNLFVSGSLRIIGSVEIDGAVFVDGDVDMKSAASVNKTGTTPVILAASGRIVLSDGQWAAAGSAPADKFIRAFVYSQQPVEMYGVASKLYLQGGVHGTGRTVPGGGTVSGVTLNALREDPGDRSDPSFERIRDGGDSGPPFLFTPTDAQLGLPADSANLQIVYDDRLFREPPAGIPVSDKTDGHVNLFVQSITHSEEEP